MFLTTPRSTLPSASVSSVCFFFSAFSSSSRTLRESTMLPRFLFTLMTRIQLLALERVEISHGTDIDLRARQERTDADVHGTSAFDPIDDAADDDLPLLVRLAH